jgi:hypothetical protein
VGDDPHRGLLRVSSDLRGDGQNLMPELYAPGGQRDRQGRARTAEHSLASRGAPTGAAAVRLNLRRPTRRARRSPLGSILVASRARAHSRRSCRRFPACWCP